MTEEKLTFRLDSKKVAVELILVGFVIICAALNYAGVSPVKGLLMIAMLLLSCFYFLTAFFIQKMNKVMPIIATITINIAASICVVGILFTMLHLHGAEQMLLVGSTSIGTGALVLIAVSYSNWTANLTPYVIRAVVLGALSLQTLFQLIKLNPTS